jgi:hypothetical protein
MRGRNARVGKDVHHQMEKTVVGTENLNAGRHVVQFCRHDEELAETVTDYPFTREAPAAARHFTVATLGAWGADDLAEDAALVATELAANAILHARSGFTVILSAHADLVRISVRDASPLAGGLRAAPLHGLATVDALASRWGVESHGNAGKTVWVDLLR